MGFHIWEPELWQSISQSHFFATGLPKEHSYIEMRGNCRAIPSFLRNDTIFKGMLFIPLSAFLLIFLDQFLGHRLGDLGVFGEFH